MLVSVYGSGSQGNTAILTDRIGNQLVIDCGIKFKKFATDINFDKCVAIVTHHHNDHCAYADKLKQFGIDVYDYTNLVVGEPNDIGYGWRVLPIPVKHGDCYNTGFIIVNLTENKKIAWFTDLEKMPNVKLEDYDLFAVECNYSEKVEADVFSYGGEIKSNNHAHLSIEKLSQWFAERIAEGDVLPKHIMFQHLSNSGLLEPWLIAKQFNELLGGKFSIADGTMLIAPQRELLRFTI